MRMITPARATCNASAAAKEVSALRLVGRFRRGGVADVPGTGQHEAASAALTRSAAAFFNFEGIVEKKPTGRPRFRGLPGGKSETHSTSLATALMVPLSHYPAIEAAHAYSSGCHFLLMQLHLSMAGGARTGLPRHRPCCQLVPRCGTNVVG